MKKRKILLILFLSPILLGLVILIPLAINYIQQNKLNKIISWESLNGPPGGQVGQLIQNSYRHNELYTTVRRSAVQPFVDVYKSEDKGESWEIIDELKDIQIVSIASFEDKLFVCGQGVFYYDNQKNLKKILSSFNSLCNEVIVSDNKLFATFRSFQQKLKGVQIQYADLTTGDFKWKKRSFSESELRDLVLPSKDIGFGYHIEVPNILALGNRILANVAVIQEGGSGQFTNDQLYISENFGETWSKVELLKAGDVIISNIIQDPNNPEHILLTLQHNIMHEFKSPISELVKESYDGGKTWNSLTNLTMESNGVMDVAITGSTYYLLNSYDFYMLKLDGSTYERIEMPKVKEFEEISFSLDTLLFDFDDPEIVYGKVGSVWSLGLVKSEDGMKTWEKMDRDIVASSRTIVVVHPEDPNTIFTSGNIIQESYLTRDGGKTWEPFSPINSVDEVRVDPNNPNHILVISEMTGIYESNDTGKTFKRINEDFSSAKIFDFEIAKDNPEKIYESNAGVGMSKYDPSLGGDPWRYIIGSPDYVYDFEIDPEDSDVLYAGYSPKIFENYSSIWRYSKSQKENFGWSELFRVENSKGITSLRFDPQNPNKIYAAVIGPEGEIYVSRDKGKTWSKLNDELTFTTIMRHSQLQVDPKNKNIVYAGTWGGGTYKTTDGGKNWVKLEQAPESPTCLAIYKKNPDIIYACDRVKPVIHKSEDGGQTWKEYYKFDRTNVLTSAVAIDPNDPDTIYAATFGLPYCVEAGALVKITNGVVVADLNENLPGIKEGIPESAVEIEVDPNNPNTIYVSKHGYGVFKSIDGGETWERLDDREGGLPRLGYYDIDVDYSNSNTLYAAGLCELLPGYIIGPTGLPQNIEQGACGAYKSTDGGKNWKRMLETEHATMAVEVDSRNPNLLYVATGAQGIFVSSDGGKTWKQENEGLPSLGTAAVIAKDGYVYAGVGGSGVYAGTVNDDFSITWDESRSNKPKAYVSKIQIEIDPRDSNRIYASAYPGGIFRSDDGGKTWYERNTSQPSIIVDDPVTQGYYSFAIDPNHPADIWQGIYGKGMFRSHEYMNVSMFANGNKNEMLGKHITAVVIDPRDSNTVYVGTQEGMFVTKDDGKSWKAMNDGLGTLDIRSLKISSLEYPPFNDDFEDRNADGWEMPPAPELTGTWSIKNDNGNYILQGIGHKFASAGLENWTDYTFESRVKLIENGVHVNYRLTEKGERYFISVHEGGFGLWRTLMENNAPVHTELARVDLPLGKNIWNTIKIVGKGNNIKVYLNGVLRINYTDNNPVLNGRIAFESLDDSTVYVDDVNVTPEKGESLVYAGTAGYGLYKLDPVTKKWGNLGRTLGSGWWTPWDRRMYQFSSLLFDSDVPGRIYYGHFPGGFFISEDNGKTWKDSSLGLGNDGIFSLSMHPTNHDILFAGTYNGVSKSVDRGKTWVIKSNGMPSEQWPYTVAIDSDNPNIMYTSTKNGKNKGFCDRNKDTFCGVVMKSINDGESWFKIMKGLNPISEFYTLIIYPPNHNILFLSTNRGVYISMNAGKSWKSINSGLPTGDGVFGVFNFVLPLLRKFLPIPTSLEFINQVRDNVAENLALTPDNKYLILGLVNYGAWKADLSRLEEMIKP